jgi:hypothetical protein
MSDTHFAKNEGVRLGLLLVLIGLISVFILLSRNSLHTSRAAGFEPSGLPGLSAGAESDPREVYPGFDIVYYGNLSSPEYRARFGQP